MRTGNTARVDWVDYAKGFCIVFVVMMHSTLGVESALGHDGWMHYFVAFAKPFRMPDFFLISGLFLSRVIDRDWNTYLDRKVVHFAYFYVLWLTIQFAFKAPSMIAQDGALDTFESYLVAFVQPFGTLWFIYLLPIFFVVTKLSRKAPKLAIWTFAAGLEIAHIETSSMVVNEFAARFVYFYTGYILARYVFELAKQAQAHVPLAIAALLAWATLNAEFVFAGYADLPLLSLGLGLIGIAAVVTFCALIAKRDLLPPLRYCGENSIVIYLAFFLPMAIARTVMLQMGVQDAGSISVIVTIAGVAGSLCLFWIFRATPLAFLYRRPQIFRLKDTNPKLALQTAK